MTELYLGGNKIQDLPSWIIELQRLQKPVLNNNQLSETTAIASDISRKLYLNHAFGNPLPIATAAKVMAYYYLQQSQSHPVILANLWDDQQRNTAFVRITKQIRKVITATQKTDSVTLGLLADEAAKPENQSKAWQQNNQGKPLPLALNNNLIANNPDNAFLNPDSNNARMLRAWQWASDAPQPALGASSVEPHAQAGVRVLAETAERRLSQVMAAKPLGLDQAATEALSRHANNNRTNANNPGAGVHQASAAHRVVNLALHAQAYAEQVTRQASSGQTVASTSRLGQILQKFMQCLGQESNGTQASFNLTLDRHGQLPAGLIAHMAMRSLTTHPENGPRSMDQWVNALLTTP